MLAVATNTESVHFPDSLEEANELPPESVAGVADLSHCGLPYPLAEVQMADKQPAAVKATGVDTDGLKSPHYAEIDFSKKVVIPAPKNELYDVHAVCRHKKDLVCMLCMVA